MLIKYGLQAIDSVALGTFVSTATAMVVICLTLAAPSNRCKLQKLDRSAAFILTGAACFISGGQILQFMALEGTDVSTVVPLVGTAAIMVYPLNYLLNRKIETFTVPTVTGGLAVIAGVLLIFWRF